MELTMKFSGTQKRLMRSMFIRRVWLHLRVDSDRSRTLIGVPFIPLGDGPNTPVNSHAYSHISLAS